MSARRRRLDPLTVGKDLLLFGVGIGLIVRQGFLVQPQDFNLWAMVFGGVAAGIPGIQNLWALRLPSSTDGPSSPDRPEPSPLPQSPSSSA